MKFSDRIGVTSVPDVLLTDSMPGALRNSLWNLLLRTIFNVRNEFHPQVTEMSAEYFFKIAVDTLPTILSMQVEWLKKLFYNAELPWWQIYNFIEFLANNCGIDKTISWLEREDFINETNATLEREMSGFRFIGGVLAPITNADEIESIRDAATDAQHHGFSGVNQHLLAAVSLLSQKPTPNYRNSIKESISALESLSKQITGQTGGGLERALTKLDESIHFHGAFKAGLLSLYGYTSDESGIRHAILNEPQVGFDEAKFMLVVCSALVNFIVMKAAKAGIIPPK